MADRAKHLAAWGAVVGIAFWIAWPLWTAESSFYGVLTGDNVQTAWFYDWTARTLAAGGDLGYLTDFNFPNPYERAIDFPAVMDAVLAAPMAWAFDWPRQFGAAQGLAVLCNALGFAWLARALGARGLGIVVAGALGACCHPAWKALHMARMNAAWPGLSAAALGATVEVLRPGGFSWSRPAWAVVAGALGAAAATAYPPFLVMLAPFGAVLILRECRRSGPWGWGFLCVALAAGVGMAFGELSSILGSSRIAPEAWGAATCLTAACPDATLTVPASRLFLWAPPNRGEQMLAGMVFSAWVLAPLCLLDPKRRGVGLVGLACLVILGVLSLGPCPNWAGQSAPGTWPEFLTRAACRVSVVHDYGRFSAIGAAIGAGLTGCGLEALQQRLSGRARWGVLFLAVAVLGMSGRYTLGQVTHPNRWTQVPQLATADFLATIETPVAELPFDPSIQYLSVLESPGIPRANPIRRSDARRESDPFRTWLHQLSAGKVPDNAPTVTQAQASGIGWVMFDPSRCGPPYPPPEACSSRVSAAITQVLGQPVSAGGTARAWQIR